MSTYRQQSRKQARNDNKMPDSMFRLGDIFLRNGRLFAFVAVLTALVGMIAALSVTPVYEANTLIQINRNAPLDMDVQANVPAATEVEILRSRSIISRVVSALQLDISVEPKLFPVLGSYMARSTREISDDGSFFGSGYVWGDEYVKLLVFNVPDALLRRPFILTVGPMGTYTLVQKERAIRIAGKIGESLKARTPFGEIDVHVSEAYASTGSQFFVSRSPRFEVVEQLRKSLSIAESGKESNVIAVALKGSKPELISRILNQIGHEYVSQHVALKSGETGKALAFYNQQLAESRQKLQKLDDRLASVLRGQGVSDLDEGTASLSQQALALQAKLAEEEQRKVELSGRFLEQHPTVVVVNRHIQDLHRDIDKIEARRRALAAAQQEIASLTRDRQTTSEINMGILNSRQKLAAMMSSENREVRVIDRAETPLAPITMKLSVMIVLACLPGRPGIRRRGVDREKHHRWKKQSAGAPASQGDSRSAGCRRRPVSMLRMKAAG